MIAPAGLLREPLEHPNGENEEEEADEEDEETNEEDDEEDEALRMRSHGVRRAICLLIHFLGASCAA